MKTKLEQTVTYLQTFQNDIYVKLIFLLLKLLLEVSFNQIYPKYLYSFTPCTSSECCGVLLFSAGNDLTGHQTSATMCFRQFVHSPLLTMLYYTGFSPNIYYMQTRPGGYKIPCKLIWIFNLSAKSLYSYYLQLIDSSCISSKYSFND